MTQKSTPFQIFNGQVWKELNRVHIQNVIMTCVMRSLVPSILAG